MEGDIYVPNGCHTWEPDASWPCEQAQVLEPGSYETVEVGSEGWLYLTTGPYHMERLILRPDANVRLDTTNGPIRIFVRWELTQFDRVRIEDSDYRIYGDLLVVYDCSGGLYCPGIYIEGNWYGTIVANRQDLQHSIVLQGSGLHQLRL